MPKPTAEELRLDAAAKLWYEGSTLPDRAPWETLALAQKRQWIEEVKEKESHQ